jgi:hypothetical protein
MNYGTRVKIGVLLILLSAVFSNLKLFKDVATGCRDAGGLDGVSCYEKRFEAVKKELPARGIVGYTSGADIKDIRFAGEETARYYLAQYAISPTILKYGAEEKLMLGNFESGVVLLRKGEK